MKKEEMPMHTDVLIVGAGPTGLMLANQLGRRGIPTTIIDRHSGPAQQTRAMAVHARTLEIYRKLGIAERAVELGAIGHGVNLWARGQRRARIPFEDMGIGLSAFPYVLMLGQDDNERIMGDLLGRWNIAVRWNTELVALEQGESGVKVTLREPDGSTRTMTASYVAGCDGARSSVRELNHIGFPGAPYEHTFFVADTVATGSMVPGELNGYLWRDGFHLFFPMRGANRWRVIGILPPDLRTKSDVTFEDLLPSLRREAGTALSFQSCKWFSTYRIYHRCTERFRDRRCILAGDAAHVHSPMGGQGMNTGLQDAYNAAWKLALVVQGRADAAILDSYEAERHPVATQLLKSTDRGFQLLVMNNWIAGLFRTRIMTNIAAFAMKRPAVRRAAFHTLSQIGIRYRQSPMSRTLAGVGKRGPQAGDRFPWLELRFEADGRMEDLFQRLDDTCFNLLVVGQPVPPAETFGLGDLLRVHAIPRDGDNAKALAAVSIVDRAFYLLRPDGHVGLVGRDLDVASVKRWFADNHVRFESAGPREANIPAADHEYGTTAPV
jgi:2-polyprenyl-6-methoxyphenol hydroxylase-like FAD-dependent oxidoreductase